MQNQNNRSASARKRLAEKIETWICLKVRYSEFFAILSTPSHCKHNERAFADINDDKKTHSEDNVSAQITFKDCTNNKQTFY